MCTLYAMSKSRAHLLALFRVSDNRAAAVEPRDAILPSETAPVVRLADDGERELVNLSWGFVRRDPGKAPRRVLNTRDDQVRTNPFWRASFEQRRCLIPVTSYSEPKGVKPATWHWFSISAVASGQPKRQEESPVGTGQLKGQEESPVGTGQLKGREKDERPLFAFAGLWRSYTGPLKKDGPSVEMDVYSFMTTEPNALTASINHERMPVLLTSDADFDTWIHGAPDEAFALCRTYPADRMQMVGAGLEKREGGVGPSVTETLLLLPRAAIRVGK
jgi:putative SOS response-associated peptidase YedK